METTSPFSTNAPFGSTLKRRRIDFVPQALPTPSTARKADGAPLGDVYLSIVLPESQSSGTVARTVLDSQPPDNGTNTTTTTATSITATTTSEDICPICNLPLSLPVPTPRDPHDLGRARPHEASLTHQLSLAHSHPPSALDRSRKGLTYLHRHGWDEDARLGLGKDGNGILFPVKPKISVDKAGVGAKVVPRKEIVKVEKLHAGQVRKVEEGRRKRGDKLRREMWGDDRLAAYGLEDG
ncbi:hypothetical protein MRB53_038918 [Persea americana]|nr:hypothetical protein MRB53_038918 [Persea americana]